MSEESEFVLVPRTPTKQMLEAAWADALAEDAAGVWKSMLEAGLEKIETVNESSINPTSRVLSQRDHFRDVLRKVGMAYHRKDMAEIQRLLWIEANEGRI
jgi:hypothetical protein